VSEITTTSNLTPVGDTLLGRVLDASGAPIDGKGPLGDLPRRAIDRPIGTDSAAAAPQALETGIKVIDLYAPIARGGTITITAVPGVGMIVNSSEIIHNIATRRGGCAVMADLEDNVYSINELVADLRSGGVDGYTAIVAAQHDAPPEVKRQVAYRGLTIAEYFCDQGRETLLFMNEHLVSDDTIERLHARRRAGSQGALTLLVWQLHTPATLRSAPARSHPSLEPDGRLVFSRELALQKIWPAIDPLASTSRLLDDQIVAPEHVRTTRAAQELLRRYGDLNGDGADVEGDQRLRDRARRVLLFQTQPFVVAEPFTAVPGEYVPLDATVRAFSELVAGQHDAVPVEAFRFIGAIDQALAKAGG
jgi:F-type H+/Na+-transporting ATPase subunit beta